MCLPKASWTQGHLGTKELWPSDLTAIGSLTYSPVFPEMLRDRIFI